MMVDVVKNLRSQGWVYSSQSSRGINAWGVRATRGFSKRKSRQDHNFRHKAPTNHKLVDFCQRRCGRAEFVGRHSTTKEASTTPTWFFIQGNYLQHHHSSIPCDLCLDTWLTLIQHKDPTSSTTVASS